MEQGLINFLRRSRSTMSNPTTNQPPGELTEFLKNSKVLILVTHINPEGDALGSTLALGIALERLGKTVALFDRDQVPEFYRFLPGWQRFMNSDFGLLLKNFKTEKGKVDGIILLDCNSPERAAIEVPSDIPLVIIDHHETERASSAIKWIEPQAPATGVLVYHLLKSLGVKIDHEIAVSLYTAIAIDTGTFRYSNTTPEVLQIAAELLSLGVKPEKISEALYDNWSAGRFKLLIKCLNTLEIDSGIAITYVTEEDFKKTGTSSEDTENFSNFPRMIKDVKVSIFLRQTGPDKWKASLRSKGEINVAKIAEVFGGGGHKNAAGFIIEGRLEDIKRLIAEEVKRAMSKG